MPSKNGKKLRFIVDLDPDDADELLKQLKERGVSSLTQLVRRLIKREAKHPRPCVASYDVNSQCTSLTASDDVSSQCTMPSPVYIDTPSDVRCNTASYDAEAIKRNILSIPQPKPRWWPRGVPHPLEVSEWTEQQVLDLRASVIRHFAGTDDWSDIADDTFQELKTALEQEGHDFDT